MRGVYYMENHAKRTKARLQAGSLSETIWSGNSNGRVRLCAMQGNWFGHIEDCSLDVPMTQHIVLQTSKPESLVWVTDTLAWLGEHTSLDVEKIPPLECR
jgi:hypothetical protein